MEILDLVVHNGTGTGCFARIHLANGRAVLLKIDTVVGLHGRIN